MMIAVALKPFAALGMFFVAAVIARWILKWIPEGRLKRLLTYRTGP